MVFPNPDLSLQIVTALVEFIVELSDPSIHSEQPLTDSGETTKIAEGDTVKYGCDETI
jgi:hypothetical protein